MEMHLRWAYASVRRSLGIHGVDEPEMPGNRYRWRRSRLCCGVHKRIGSARRRTVVFASALWCSQCILCFGASVSLSRLLCLLFRSVSSVSLSPLSLWLWRRLHLRGLSARGSHSGPGPKAKCISFFVVLPEQSGADNVWPFFL